MQSIINMRSMFHPNETTIGVTSNYALLPCRHPNVVSPPRIHNA